MAKKLWGGRFEKPTDPVVEQFTRSIHFDQKLAAYDIKVSIVHSKALAKAGILSASEKAKIVKTLTKILTSAQKGTLRFDQSCEDVHTAIENILKKQIGEAADKLHAGRSRNEQVAMAMRLYLKDAVKDITELIRQVQKSLVNTAKRNMNVLIPGFTHLQHAQPVLFGHHLLAYVQMLERDKARLADAFKRTDVLPSGSAALAGTSISLDRKYMAKLLGFSAISQNSMDAVSDRDFVIETLSALAVLAMHLSRIGEDLIIFSTSEFGIVELDQAYCTGSSIMPQKKNPDPLELIRGSSGRVYGNLLSVLVMMKGLPLTYNRDMQLDKEPLFESVEVCGKALAVLIGLIRTLKVNRKPITDQTLMATDLAEYLVKKGVAFRTAHTAVGKLVAFCEQKKTVISGLSVETLKKFDRRFEKDVYKLLKPEVSVALKNIIGGTAPSQVKKQIRRWEKELQ